MPEDDKQNLHRITVSRDALRADLSELELRLRIYFDDQLRHKADLAVVLEHALQIARWERGELTPPQERALDDRIERALAYKTDEGWTAKQRVFGTIAIIVAVLSLLFTMYMWFSPSVEAGERSHRGLAMQAERV